MIIATVWKTASADQENALYNVEAFIMTVFGIGGALAPLSASLSHNPRLHSESRLKEMGRFCLILAFNVYSIWFWYKGIHTLVSEIERLRQNSLFIVIGY